MMSQLRSYIFINLKDEFLSYAAKQDEPYLKQWRFNTTAGNQIFRLNWLDSPDDTAIKSVVRQLNDVNITPVLVINEADFKLIEDIDGYFECLYPSYDGIEIKRNLLNAVDIVDSFLSVFKQDYMAIYWIQYELRQAEQPKLFEQICAFSKNLLLKFFDNLDDRDKSYFNEIASGIDPKSFVLEQDGETFHHPAVPFFKIRPKSELCELPLPTHEFRVKLISALKQKLPAEVVSKEVERISVLDGLAELARQGTAIVTTWVNAASLDSVRRQLIGMGVAHANASEKADGVSVSGVFPINATFAEDQRILTLTLMAHNLENSDLSKLSVSAYWDAQPLTCRRLDMGNNTSAVKLEVEMPEYVSSNSFNYVCTFNTAEASLRIDIGQEV